MAPHVVFIHGMYLNGQSWQPWVESFTSAGFDCSAPSWPYRHGDPRTLRLEVDPQLGALAFDAVTEHLKSLIDALPERPILVGRESQRAPEHPWTRGQDRLHSRARASVVPHRHP